MTPLSADFTTALSADRMTALSADFTTALSADRMTFRVPKNAPYDGGCVPEEQVAVKIDTAAAVPDPS